MNSHRKTAIIVGILFLIALIFNIVGMSIYQPILDSPDYLTSAFPNKISVIIGILIDSVCIPAIVLISIIAYPIFKQYNERLAIGYVVFRAFEGVLFAICIVKSLSLISLSQDYLSGGAMDPSYYQAIGNSIHAEHQWITLIYIIIFSTGAIIFYFLLYQSKLIPRFLSLWGLCAAVFLFTGGLIGIFELFPLSIVMTVCGLPIALNELTLAVWLIVKGFNINIKQQVK